MTRPAGRVDRIGVPALLRDHHDRIHAMEAVAPAAIYEIKVVSDERLLLTGDGQFHWAIPTDLDQWYIVDAQAFVSTVSSSGTPTIQIFNRTIALDILLTRITIDVGEFTSYSAATPRVINQTGDRDQVAEADMLRIDVDVAGTGAKGLGVIVTLSPARYT